MAKPIWNTGNTQALLGSGSVTSVQVSASGSAQLFDSATGANGITMTVVLQPGSHDFPNGLSFSKGVYVSGSGAWVVGIAGAGYIEG
jgi:hypothetical protein